MLPLVTLLSGCKSEANVEQEIGCGTLRPWGRELESESHGLLFFETLC